MPATVLFHTSSQVLHLIMGGVAVFCLFYAGVFYARNTLPDYEFAEILLLEALKYGGIAVVITYFQDKCLNR